MQRKTINSRLTKSAYLDGTLLCFLLEEAKCTGFDGARYRSGEMQVSSRAMGKEKFHYEAPAPQTVKSEVDVFGLVQPG